MKTIFRYITVVSLALLPLSCSKDDNTPVQPGEELSQSENQIFSVSQNFLPSNIQTNFKQTIIAQRSDSNYQKLLITLDRAVNRLDSVLRNAPSSANQMKNVQGAYDDLKTTIDDISRRLQTKFGNIACGLSNLALGYGKGGELDGTLSINPLQGIKVALQGQGGGGIEIVWDLPNQKRAIFPFTVCGVGGSIGGGLHTFLEPGAGFTGYVDLILGFRSTRDITDFKGPALGLQFSLDILPIPVVDLSPNFGLWISNNHEVCNFGTNVQCPELDIDPAGDSFRGVTLGITAGVATEWAVEIQGGLIGYCFWTPWEMETYELPFQIDDPNVRRWYAGIMIASEIMGSKPVLGLNTTVSSSPVTPSLSYGPDLFAAALAILYSSFPPSSCAAPVTVGLVAQYPFNGNANDESGSGKNGTPVNNPTYGTGRSTRSGSALQLNGTNQYVSLPSSIRITYDISISFWMKTNLSDNGSWPWGTFIVDRDLCNPLRDWSVGLGLGGKLQWNTGKVGTDYPLSSTSNVNDDNWNHIVVLRDTANQIKKIYINGQFNASASFDKQAFANNSISIYVGASVCNTSTHHYYRGLIDDLRLYNRVLTEAEIQQLYNER